jgi:hypothetical protein
MLKKLGIAGCLLIAFACDSEGTEDDNMMCGGHGQPACNDMAYRDLEGGEVRLEYRLLPNLSEVAVAQAWFVNGQVPAKLPGPMFNTCSDITKYETTSTPSMANLDSRQFYDVGDTVTITGAGKEMVLTKNLDTPDFRNQVEGIIYVKDGKAQGGVATTDIVPGNEYTPTFANGENPNGTVYMPKNWVSTSGPAFDGTVYNAVRGEPITFTWDADDGEGAETAPFAFMAFFAKDNSSRWFCLHDNTGSITIPGDITAQFGAEGNILGAVLQHRRINYKDRNLDLVAINCKIQSFTAP